jgi:hypothetical protein
MRCSWHDSFRIDNENISFIRWACDGNFPVKITLQAFQSKVFNTILKETTTNRKDTFRIGLIMLNEEELKSFDLKINPELKYKNKTYWSNSVSLISKRNYGYQYDHKK